MARITVTYTADGDIECQIDDDRGGPDVLDDLTRRTRELMRDVTIDLVAIRHVEDDDDGQDEP